MATATMERMTVSMDDYNDNAFSFKGGAGLEWTTAFVPEAFSGFFITQIIYATKHSTAIPLRGENYPALVSLWDNDVDAVYDTI